MQQLKKEKRKRLLIMLPVFLAPVIFLGYLFFGKSGKQKDPIGPVADQSAFNAKLPSANVKETSKNKLEIYMQAQKDSAKRQDQLRSDPYEKQWFDPAPPMEVQKERVERSKNIAVSQSMDANEQKVNQRLEQLMRELNQPETTPVTTKQITQPQSQIDEAYLEQLMASLNNTDVQDPELNRIEYVLERVLDIQHPERVKQRLSGKKDTLENPSLPVSTEPEVIEGNNSFFGLQEDFSLTPAAQQTTILAHVPEDQVVQNGSTISFRLLQDVFVGAQLIPKGNQVSGRCELAGERVNVQLKEIVYNNVIYPISLVAYDIDGIQGIKVPGALARDEAKNSLGGAVQSMDIYSGAPTVAGQAAQAGIQAAKSLFSKKSRKVTATVRASHKVLLKKASN